MQIFSFQGALALKGTYSFFKYLYLQDVVLQDVDNYKPNTKKSQVPFALFILFSYQILKKLFHYLNNLP
jgi:hypothetical protein